MVPICGVIAGAWLCWQVSNALPTSVRQTPTVAAAGIPWSQHNAIQIRLDRAKGTHGRHMAVSNHAPGTLHARHNASDTAHHRTPASIEAMATLSSVFSAAEGTAEAAQRLSVQHTYECMLTAYGPGFESTGKHPGDKGYGITATGRLAMPHHTVAVDPHLIPLGSLVYIDGIGYRVAEDVGGAIRGEHIDIFFRNDQDAKKFGVKSHVKVFVFSHVRRSSDSN